MKKMLSVAAILAAVSALSVSAFADATVHVTISNAGKLAAADEAVDVSDIDGDGSITIADALILAHDEFYDGGSDAGFATAEGDYGPMITKLWGVENGGSYGYYLNNTMAMGLSDEIKDGDHLNAFVYADATGWSDKYCYFNEFETEVEGDKAEFTLSAASFDENWAPITVPVAGAAITIDGEKTDFVTDENGKVTVEFPETGKTYLLSAVSDTETLVPPVLTVETIGAAVNDDAASAGADDGAAPAAGDVDAATDSSKGSPDTGVEDVAAVAGIAVLALGAFVVTKNRK